MVKVNPRQARAHAETLGRRAKTGHVDAAMLACPGALLAPLVRPLIGAVPDQMKEPRAARSGRMELSKVPFSNFSLLQCASTCGADIRQPITAEVGARDQRSAADAPHTRV
jgi:hypothetical protein